MKPPNNWKRTWQRSSPRRRSGVRTPARPQQGRQHGGATSLHDGCGDVGEESESRKGSSHSSDRSSGQAHQRRYRGLQASAPSPMTPSHGRRKTPPGVTSTVARTDDGAVEGVDHSSKWSDDSSEVSSSSSSSTRSAWTYSSASSGSSWATSTSTCSPHSSSLYASFATAASWESQLLTHHLPYELFLHVCSFLSEADYCTLLETNRELHCAIACADAVVWRDACLRRWRCKQGFQNFVLRFAELQGRAHTDELEILSLQQRMIVEEHGAVDASDVHATCDEATEVARRRLNRQWYSWETRKQQQQQQQLSASNDSGDDYDNDEEEDDDASTQPGRGDNSSATASVTTADVPGRSPRCGRGSHALDSHEPGAKEGVAVTEPPYPGDVGYAARQSQQGGARHTASPKSKFTRRHQSSSHNSHYEDKNDDDERGGARHDPYPHRSRKQKKKRQRKGRGHHHRRRSRRPKSRKHSNKRKPHSHRRSSSKRRGRMSQGKRTHASTRRMSKSARRRRRHQRSRDRQRQQLQPGGVAESLSNNRPAALSPTATYEAIKSATPVLGAQHLDPALVLPLSLSSLGSGNKAITPGGGSEGSVLPTSVAHTRNLEENGGYRANQGAGRSSAGSSSLRPALMSEHPQRSGTTASPSATTGAPSRDGLYWWQLRPEERQRRLRAMQRRAEDMIERRREDDEREAAWRAIEAADQHWTTSSSSRPVNSDEDHDEQDDEEDEDLWRRLKGGGTVEEAAGAEVAVALALRSKRVQFTGEAEDGSAALPATTVSFFAESSLPPPPLLKSSTTNSGEPDSLCSPQDCAAEVVGLTIAAATIDPAPAARAQPPRSPRSSVMAIHSSTAYTDERYLSRRRGRKKRRKMLGSSATSPGDPEDVSEWRAPSSSHRRVLSISSLRRHRRSKARVRGGSLSPYKELEDAMLITRSKCILIHSLKRSPTHSPPLQVYQSGTSGGGGGQLPQRVRALSTTGMDLAAGGATEMPPLASSPPPVHWSTRSTAPTLPAMPILPARTLAAGAVPGFSSSPIVAASTIAAAGPTVEDNALVVVHSPEDSMWSPTARTGGGVYGGSYNDINESSGAGEHTGSNDFNSAVGERGNDNDDDDDYVAAVSWKFAYYMSRREAKRARITVQDLLCGTWLACFRVTGRVHQAKFLPNQTLVVSQAPVIDVAEANTPGGDSRGRRRPAVGSSSLSSSPPGTERAEGEAAPGAAAATMPPLSYHVLQGGALLSVMNFPPLKVERRVCVAQSDGSPAGSVSPVAATPRVPRGGGGGGSEEASAAFLAEPQRTLSLLRRLTIQIKEAAGAAPTLQEVLDTLTHRAGKQTNTRAHTAADGGSGSPAETQPTVTEEEEEVGNDWGWTVSNNFVKLFSLDVQSPLYVERLQRIVPV